MAKLGGDAEQNRFGFADDFGTNSITGEEDNLRVHVWTLDKQICRTSERADSTAPPGRLPAVGGRVLRLSKALGRFTEFDRTLFHEVITPAVQNRMDGADSVA